MTEKTNTISERLSAARNHFVAAFLSLGSLPTIAIVFIILIVAGIGGYYAIGGISDAWKNSRQEKQLADAVKAQADAEQKEKAAELRAATAEGKANDIEHNLEALNHDYNLVLDRYRELRKVSDAARDDYEKAKAQGLKLNGGTDLNKRFRDLSRTLDELENPGSDANP